MAKTVDAYLENLETVLRGELMKYTTMDHDEGALACARALNTVKDLKDKINTVEDVRRAYLVL